MLDGLGSAPAHLSEPSGVMLLSASLGLSERLKSHGAAIAKRSTSSSLPACKERSGGTTSQSASQPSVHRPQTQDLTNLSR